MFSLLLHITMTPKGHWVKKMFAMKLSVEAGKMLVF